MDSYYHHHEET
ncbi:unnamed protein product, partial [Didymodactylos carnosus]